MDPHNPNEDAIREGEPPYCSDTSHTTMKPSNDGEATANSRNRVAIGVAFALGVLIGVFLYVSAVPFGPILLGMIVALLGAIVVPSALCILATKHYAIVAFGYAAGVAAGATTSGIVFPRSAYEWWDPPLQFAIIFVIVSIPSLVCVGVCALLKWEDKKARDRNK